jgi:hypothetical protein
VGSDAWIERSGIDGDVYGKAFRSRLIRTEFEVMLDTAAAEYAFASTMRTQAPAFRCCSSPAAD